MADDRIIERHQQGNLLTRKYRKEKDKSDVNHQHLTYVKVRQDFSLRH